MEKNGTRLRDRVLSLALAAVMLIALFPMSTLSAFAASVEAGSSCQETDCSGKLKWFDNSKVDGMHYLVCDNAACVCSGVEKAYLAHNQGDGVADCLVCNPPHVHGEFVYSLENKDQTLVATCGSAGTCDLTDKKVSITISAPASLAYDEEVKKASITGAEEWKTVTGNDVPEIQYSAEPKTVGNYTASITVDSKTASVAFSIVKGTPSYVVPSDLTAEYGQKLASVKLPAGFKWINENESVGEVGTRSFRAMFTPSDTDNYNAVEMNIPVAVGKATRSIAAPSISGEATCTSITVEKVTPTVGDDDDTVEYGYTDNENEEVTNWQTETVFDGLEGSKTYYFFARVSETDHYASAVSLAKPIATKNKENGEIALSIEGWTYGAYDETVNAPKYNVVKGEYDKIAVQYAPKGTTDWSGAVPSKAGKYTVRVVCSATATWAEAIESCDFEIAQREITVDWSNVTLTYNAEEQKPTAVISEGSILGEDVVEVSVTGAKINKGADYTAKAGLIGDDAGNYCITNETQQFSIQSKDVEVTWSNTSFTHNGMKHKPTATIEVCENDKGVVTVEVSGEQANTGKYTATAELVVKEDKDKDKVANYEIVNPKMDFEISDIVTPENPYTIVKVADGTAATPNENGWYNYNIVIKPKDGYKIGTANEEDSDFGDSVLVGESKKEFKVFLKEDKQDGGYTGAILVGDINIDKVDPTATVELNKDNFWKTFLNTITFGLFFNTEQQVTISAEDDGDENSLNNSGIDTVSYYVSNEGLSLETVQGLGDDSWKEGASVSFDEDNDYIVYAKIVDKAGNVTYASSNGFVYDDTKPVIQVSFDNNTAANGKYFNRDRTITIQVIEHNFDADKIDVDVKITAKDAAGKDVTIDDYAAYAKKPENWTHDGDTHTLRSEGMRLSAEACYTFDVSCKDKAGNENDGVKFAEGTVAPTEFVIDKSKPNASLTIEGKVKDAPKSWSETWATADGDDLTAGVLTSIDYNSRWSNSAVSVSATSEDGLSGIDYMEYFRTENIVSDITAADIEWSNSTKELAVDRDSFNFEVAPNEKFIVYMHIVDKAGNSIYLSSNGVIVDDKAPGGDKYSPEIDISLSNANANGIYNNDDTVKVDFTAVEPKYRGAGTQSDAGIYSGIKEIKYVIEAKDINASEEYTFDLEKEGSAQRDASGLISSWRGSIVIDKEKFNSNNVTVLITAIDNAGNPHTSMATLKIDVTNPTIDVSYDNNDADSETYFKANRIATIVVAERNFDPKDVKIVIKNTDGTIPSIGEWVKTEGTGNKDNTQWTTRVTYSADGDYTFDIAYTDLADNACTGARYGDSVAPTEFTIDKTLPVVSVSYSNNDAKNEKYFAASRTATIVVEEHNFDVNRVTYTQSATLNGANIAIPAASWVSNGDVHTATIVFSNDGDYTFDVSVKDMAGNDSEAANYGNSVAGKDFVIDQTIEKPTISGIKNGGAYKNDVIPGVSFNDVNYDSCEIKLVRTRMGAKNVDVTAEYIKGLAEQTQGLSGLFDTFKKEVENDGIYTLSIKVLDKAGNEESEEYTFSVNRFGSVYEYSDKLIDLIKDGGQYVQSIDEDLVITEYNADRLLAGSLNILITRDGENVDTDYTSNPQINSTVSVGESGWYQYTYTIKASNFKQDGVYKISLTSKYAADDSAENESTSVPENSIDKSGAEILDTMNFTVDSVAPEIRNIVNLDKKIADKDKIVDGKLNVKYTIVDVGGLSTIEIIVNGKTIQKLSKEDIADSRYSFTGDFDLDEQSGTIAQKVQLRVTDLAGNVTDTNSDDFLAAHSSDNESSTYVFNNEVTVSRNFFVRWYANTGLFWGSVAGVVVLAGAIWFFISSKKKKTEESK